MSSSVGRAVAISRRSRRVSATIFADRLPGRLNAESSVGALEGPQTCVAEFRAELQARRDLFYRGIREHADEVFAGDPPRGAFYAFLRINPDWRPPSGKAGESLSWTMAEYLISRGRIGCVPGVDFGASGEGYVRFCFARDRKELIGALESMSAVFCRV